MTSKALFSKLLRGELKRRVWVMVVALLTAILSGPVVLLLQYENFLSYMMPGDLQTAMLDALRPSISNDMFVTTGLAVLLAITGFAYLFSKKKVDLYHSIPVKREKLFMASYLSGILIYLGMYAVKTAAVIMVAAGRGFFTKEAGMVYLHTVLGNVIHFLLIYHVIIIAVMLTGNLLVSIAASGVLLLYGFIISQVLRELSSMYFCTYCYESSNSTEAWKSAAFISPVTSFDFFINSCSEYSDVTAGQQTGHLLLTLVFAAVLFIPAIYLYKKRPSEAAGKALAFQKTEVFIRIPIVIVSALVGGIVFVSINNYSKSNWFWFGLIFTGILCHCLIEIIYRFDFKAFWNHKIQLLCCLAAAILIGLIYRQDLTGYDTYLPAKEDIKSTSVVFTNIDNDLSGFQFESVDKEKFVSGKYGDRISELLRNASFSDTDAVYALGKLGIENLELMEEEDQVLYSSAREISVASAGDTAAEESTATPLYYSVRYTLKNGKTRYRNYAVSVEDVSDAFARVYNNKEYKENSFDIFPMTEENAFRKVEVYDVWGTKQLSLTDGEMNSFLEAYEADFLNLSGETLETEVPVARLSPIFREKDCAYDDSLGGYYIYPSFIKTMTAMRELGVDLTEMKTSFDPEDLESIKVNDCGYLSDVLGITDGYSEGKLYVNSDVQDKQMIEELCGDLVNSNYAWSNMVLCPFEQRIEFDLLYKTEEGIQKTACAYMKSEQIPQQVIDDLAAGVENDE